MDITTERVDGLSYYSQANRSHFSSIIKHLIHCPKWTIAMGKQGVDIPNVYRLLVLRKEGDRLYLHFVCDRRIEQLPHFLHTYGLIDSKELISSEIKGLVHFIKLYVQLNSL